jgi:hypothetical protein
MHVHHANSLAGPLTLLAVRQLDDPTFHEDSGDKNEKREEDTGENFAGLHLR